MAQVVPFGQPPRRPQSLVDKIQILLILWPEAGRELERIVDEMLTKLGWRW